MHKWNLLHLQQSMHERNPPLQPCDCLLWANISLNYHTDVNNSYLLTLKHSFLNPSPEVIQVPFSFLFFFFWSCHLKKCGPSRWLTDRGCESGSARTRWMVWGLWRLITYQSFPTPECNPSSWEMMKRQYSSLGFSSYKLLFCVLLR